MNLAATVVHIEDDPLWAAAVEEQLRCWPEIRYVGLATTGSDGIALCAEKKPGVVLLDLRLPDVDGLILAGKLRRLSDAPRIMVLSSRNDEATLCGLSAGDFAGLLWKTGDCRAHLRAALAAVAAGGAYIPAAVNEAMRRFRGGPAALTKILSARELSLLDVFGRGDSDAQIAAPFGLSPETVHSHRTRIIAKLGLSGTCELMRWARDRGFGVSLGRVLPPSLDRISSS